MTLDIRTHLIENGVDLWIDVEDEWAEPGPDGKRPTRKRLEGVTWTLGMCSIAAGMPRLTEANKGEFLRRLRVMEDIYGPLMNQGPAPVLFTEEDIERRIGLRTNATELTKAKFEANMAKARKQAEREKAAADAYAARQKQAGA